ncbi:MAG TPA: cyclic nucleotide-binding domain-containing protein, partial [Burkholderiaceae bacterium]|nr:cyclic nucleotide-binding domain-containing protein [Burkholderiaceae bacterium]
MHNEALIDVLRATRWGSQLTPEQMQRVAGDSISLTVPEGGALCRRGEPVDAWIGVIEGLVKMMQTTPDGRTSTFTGVPAGGWFGEGSL